MGLRQRCRRLRAGCMLLQVGGMPSGRGAYSCRLMCMDLQAGGMRLRAGCMGSRAGCLRHVDVALRGDALRRGAAAREPRETG